MKKLIKSYNFWSALAGSIGLLAVNVAKLFGYEITATGVEEIIMAICGVLVVFGIVKKPTKQQNVKENTQVVEGNTDANNDSNQSKK